MSPYKIGDVVTALDPEGQNVPVMVTAIGITDGLPNGQYGVHYMSTDAVLTLDIEEPSSVPVGMQATTPSGQPLPAVVSAQGITPAQLQQAIQAAVAQALAAQAATFAAAQPAAPVAAAPAAAAPPPAGAPPAAAPPVAAAPAAPAAVVPLTDAQLGALNAGVAANPGAPLTAAAASALTGTGHTAALLTALNSLILTNPGQPITADELGAAIATSANELVAAGVAPGAPAVNVPTPTLDAVSQKIAADNANAANAAAAPAGGAA